MPEWDAGQEVARAFLGGAGRAMGESEGWQAARMCGCRWKRMREPS